MVVEEGEGGGGGGLWGIRWVDVPSGVRQRRQRMVVDCGDGDDDDDEEGDLEPVVVGELEVRELGSLLSLKWMVDGARPVDRVVSRFRW